MDRSAAGAQPMTSACGDHVIVYNGELYNFRDLRVELDGYPFVGGSDTEVLVAAIAKWGFEGAIRRASGMFAVAAWDRRNKTLSLARDRLGEKPLYYTAWGHCFAFASELQALTGHPAFDRRIDHSAVAEFLQHTYVPGPRTVYEGVRKLMPGSIMSVSLRSGQGQSLNPRSYWTLPLRDEQCHPSPDVDELDTLLRCCQAPHDR